MTRLCMLWWLLSWLNPAQWKEVLCCQKMFANVSKATEKSVNKYLSFLTSSQQQRTFNVSVHVHHRQKMKFPITDISCIYTGEIGNFIFCPAHCTVQKSLQMYMYTLLHTWVSLSDIIIHVEPVIQSHELEEGEACLSQVPISVRVHLAVQSPANDCKDVQY